MIKKLHPQVLKIIIVCCLLGFPCCRLLAQNCLSPQEFVTRAFKKYKIIGLDEGPHATLQGHEYLRKLISDPKVNNMVDYIILEVANETQQHIVDQYISGHYVPTASLKLIWRTGTQAHNAIYGEAPVYLKLLKTVRDLNKNHQHKIKIIAADPAINWAAINTIKDYFKQLSQRDVLPAKEAIRLGIDSNRKVLLIYGGEHFNRKAEDNKSDSTHWSIDYYVNKKYPGVMISIGITDSAKREMKDHCVCLTKDAGAANYAVYYRPDLKKWVIDHPKFIEASYFPELNRRSLIVWKAPIDSTFKKE